VVGLAFAPRIVAWSVAGAVVQAGLGVGIIVALLALVDSGAVLPLFLAIVGVMWPP
jgi:hypothetical protein